MLHSHNVRAAVYMHVRSIAYFCCILLAATSYVGLRKSTQVAYRPLATHVTTIPTTSNDRAKFNEY